MIHKNELLRQAIPVDKICRACLRPQVDPHKWRLSLFGDAICTDCFDKEREAYPDLYGDIENRRELYLWQKALGHLKKKHKQRAAAAELLAGTQCALCTRIASPDNHDNSKTWIHKHGVWICQECWRVKQELEPGQYREDKQRRIFHVTKQLKARYVFGLQAIPRRSTNILNYSAATLLYEQQRAAMFETIQQHWSDIQEIYKQLAKRKTLDLDTCYDLTLSTAMKAATLYKPSEGPFKAYLYMAASNAWYKAANRKNKLPLAELLTLPENVLYPDAPTEIEKIERYDSEIINLTAYWQAVVDRIGAEDWYIFTSWVLQGRSQAQIGKEIGVISQTISMRIKRVLATCRQLAYILQTD